MIRYRNLLFVARGPGTSPILRSSGVDLVEVIWHSETIAQHARGDLATFATRVIVDPDRTKRKFVCVAEHYEMLRTYERVAVLDDDLTLERGDWADVFAAFAATPLVIAQPALTEQSTNVWPVTRVDRACRYRVTDFVEVMAPIFTRASLAACVSYFLEDRNGWGLEALWSARFRPIGILDSTPMIHTRPVGSAHSLTGLAVHPETQASAFRTKYGWSLPRGCVRERWSPSGEALDLQQRCAFAGCRNPAAECGVLCAPHRTPGALFL